MAQLMVLYWRDIPAQVIAEEGRGRKRTQAKIELHRRFALAIDEAAMRDGADSTDDYLADWRRGEAVACSADLQAEVEAKAAEIEAAFDSKQLANLVASGGHHTKG
jgi:hypothetical protein